MTELRNSFEMPDDFFREVAKHLFFNRDELMRLPAIRAALADARYKARAAAGLVATIDGNNSIAETVTYNAKALSMGAALERVTQLAAPLLALSSHAYRLSQLDLLAVGPRSEVEIMALVGLGFDLKRIKAIDLISYSPFVELMDVSAMRYPDNSFDVAVIGWVMAYIADPTVAAQELARVVRPGGLISVGVDYCKDADPNRAITPGNINVTRNYLGPEDVLKEFGPAVGRVVFASPAAHPTNPMQKHIVVTFEVQK